MIETGLNIRGAMMRGLVGGAGATAHRYYRMYLLPNNLNEAELAQVEFRTTAGSSASDVLAGASSITWTGTVFSGAVANITDGNPATFLAYARSNRFQYLDIDLGSEQDVAEVWFKNGTTASRGPGGFMLVGSTDNITFDPLFGLIYLSHSQAAGAEFATQPPDLTTAQVWGLMAISSADASWMHVHEAEFRGSIGGADLTGSGAGVASAAFSGTSSGVQAFDNDTAARWSTTDTTSGGPLATHPTLAYDFGTATAVAELSMQADAVYSIPTRHLHDFIAFATDGDFSGWTSTTGATPAAGYVVDLKKYVVGASAFSQGETRDYAL